MWGLPRPSIDPEEVFRACISGVREPQQRARLTNFVSDVVSAARLYAAAAEAGGLHTLEALKRKPDSKGDRADLQKTYTDGLVGRVDGRVYYDQLLAAARHGRCPFCGHRTVATLDHQLPKSMYPLLAVTPDNLVPACFDCNHRKSDAAPTSAAEQGLHPYFEDADSGRWLFARVDPLRHDTITFRAEPDDSFDPTVKARICRQFDQLGLSRLYGLQAAQEVVAIDGYIRNLRRFGGAFAVKQHLQERAESEAARSPNCWQRAMYEGLAADYEYLRNG